MSLIATVGNEWLTMLNIIPFPRTHKPKGGGHPDPPDIPTVGVIAAEKVADEALDATGGHHFPPGPLHLAHRATE